MKGLKLSKTSWLILSAGVFLLVLAGLGLTRSQQMKEQTKVGDELNLSEKRLGTIQTTQLSQQLESLRGKVEESEAQMKEAQARLHRTVISVDVTEVFFNIAEYCDVTISTMSTTTIAQTKYENITCSKISLSATVTGTQSKLIDFIIGLNKGYTTGNVETAQITAEEPSGEDETPGSGGFTASISMIIYSYEGN